ncbi:MAG: cell envelope integrity protein TolA [Symbiopectobacterium sp.]|uniref:cell envelope integrity protein TolA n=1 Tax=Symbiopectobacterium sp. TaxID=2952789 RepID=UPI003F335DC6
MLKATEKPDKLKRAIIVSAVLHIILIALLVWSSFHFSMDASGGGGGSAIDAVMVDPNAVVEQYNRQQHEELQQKQAAEQQRLKELEKERLQAQEDAKQQAQEQAEQRKQAEAAAAKAKAEAEQQAKAAADSKKKAEEEVKKQAAVAAKKQAEEEAKAKAVADAKAKAAADAKAKAAADKKAAAEAAAQSDSVDDLLSGLASSKNAPKSGGGAPAGAGAAKKSGASGAALDSYGGQVRAEIQSKFYDWQLYRGKTCTLRIKLAPDGLLVSVEAESGDPALCQAAIAAAKQARIPKPPSTDVYEAFKNAPIDFKPQ